MTKRILFRRAAVPLVAVSLFASLGAPMAGAVDVTHSIAAVTATGLDGPTSSAVDTDGNLYIADALNGRVIMIDPLGVQTAVAGTGTAGGDGTTGIGGAATSFQLSNPTGVAVGSNGTVYVADGGHDKVFAVSGSNITLFAGDGTEAAGAGQDTAATGVSLFNPFDVAVDSKNVVYISETGANRISMVPTAGDDANDIFTYAGQSDGTGGATGVDAADASAWQLSGPMGIDVDKNNDIYIADTGNHRIVMVDAPTPAGGPTVVADLLTATASRIAGTGTTGDGVTDTLAAATGAALASPEGVAVDKGLNVYIADTGNNEVHKINTSDNIIRLAGSAGAAGSAGEALHSTIAAPNDVATDKHGNLYISVTGSDQVLRVTQPDLQPPTISISSPVTSTVLAPVTTHEVEIDDVVTINFTCDDFYVGVQTCTATLDGTPVIDGATVDTSVAGDQVLVVTAVDNAVAEHGAVADNEATMTVTITVNAADPGPDPDPDPEPDPEPEVDPRIVTGDYANASGNTAAVARLYIAIMKRQPEPAGLEFWVGELEAGRQTLDSIAAYFISEDEFDSLYGDTDVEEFVRLLYFNVMDRDSTEDPTGKLFWEGVLNDKSWTRLQVTMFFSQSSEFMGHTQTS